MKTNIDTIRKALEVLKTGAVMMPLSLYMDGTRSYVPKLVSKREREELADKALAALSTIDPDAKSQEPGEDIKQLVDDIIYSLSVNVGNQKVESITASITAHDDAIRRECDTSVQDTLTICGIHKDAGIRSMLSKAILATEPSREDDEFGPVNLNEVEPDRLKPAREES